MQKSHVPWNANADMVFKTMNYYWQNMYRECEEYVKQWYKCQTH